MAEGEQQQPRATGIITTTPVRSRVLERAWVLMTLRVIWPTIDPDTAQRIGAWMIAGGDGDG